MNTASLIAFVALSLTALTLWLPRFYFVAMITVSIAILGYMGLIQVIGIVWLMALTIFCVLFMRNVGLRRLLWGCCLVVLALALGMHLLRGFHPIALIAPVVLSPGAAPFTLQLSSDKILAGLIVAATVWRRYLHSTQEFVGAAKQAAPLIAINVAILITLSIGLGYLNFAPKYTPLFFIWAVHNLLFTCLSEEVFFRGFLQQELSARFAAIHHGSWVALMIASLLFGLVHFAGGWQYLLLATIAGLGYGYIFIRTQRIEMPILAHFVMNAMHFLLFAYPRLA